MVHLLGIRHHGPGSTTSLLETLQSLQPDCLLIEGPADAESILQYIGHEELIPPVAMLIYNPKDFEQAIYLPFASFSPEWQALQFAKLQSIPARFIDLPQSIQFGLQITESEDTQIDFNFKDVHAKEEKLLINDPLRYMAKLAGYTDSERWWEVTFEQWSGEQIFPVILEMMSELRQSNPLPSPNEQLREAYMRKAIRQAVQEGYEQIAVVCGAWHTPALQLEQHKSSADNKLLRGLKRIKTKATWIPWTYERLSIASGYGAGIVSPAYYELLFENKSTTVIQWLTKVARLFREQDLDASSAHIIEAVRLAEMLASMRRLQIAGIDELREAAVAIFCEGYASQMSIIEEHLIIGDRIGGVPEDIPLIPLQQDLERCIKSARLSKERKSTSIMEKELDLRKSTNLLASQLLHRLNLLGIEWGWQKQVRKYGLAGTFHEMWKLKWKPEFAMQLIEAGIWGNTVREAALNKVRQQIQTVQHLHKLSLLLEQLLKAELPEVVALLIHQLQQLAATTQDVQLLMEAMPSLVKAMRYGSSRRLATAMLKELIAGMVPRITLALPMACTALDEAASQELFKKLLATHHAIYLLEDESYIDPWHLTLQQITALQQANALLRGLCTRLIFDKEVITLNQCAQQIAYALSPGNALHETANWMEGFLHGSGLLLIHNPSLWTILDEWIAALPMQAFQEVLPLLRRSFSNFSTTERQKMLELAKKGQVFQKQVDQPEAIDKKRAAKVVPIVRQLLGL